MPAWRAPFANHSEWPLIHSIHANLLADFRCEIQRAHMRLGIPFCAILGLAAAVAPASAQQQLAIPTTLRSVLRSPPAEGRLVRVSGYLEFVGQSVVLRDVDAGQKIDLDFSGSTVPLERLIRLDGASPVEITGRMKASTNNGRPSLAVVGGISLTP